MKYSFPTIFVLSVSFFLTSCDDVPDVEDITESPEEIINHIEFDNNTYPLSWGAIGLMEEDGKNVFFITIFSSGIDFGDTMYDIEGEGNMISILGVSDLSESIEGDYNMVEYGLDNYNPGDFLPPWLTLKTKLVDDVPVDSNYEIDSFLQGELSISHSGDEYIVTLNAREDRGIPIIIYYKGLLLNKGEDYFP